MNNEFITLAIHKIRKAQVLKDFLERNGIAVELEEQKKANSEDSSSDYYIKIEYKNLARALSLIEANKLFSYKDERTHRIDDGRRRILVAVDFSDYSTKACQVAFNIAKELDAKVKILHVYQNIYFPSHIPFADSLKETPDEGLLNKTRKQMLDFCCEIDRYITDGKWPSVNYSYSLREGQVDEEVEAFVEEYDPALLVLGTKGKDNNMQSILGNVTADIIEIVNVPVLAVPSNSPINSISDVKHIAFLTSLQQKDVSSFVYLLEQMKSYQNVKITLLQVNRKSNKLTETEMDKMELYFAEHYPQLDIDYKLINSAKTLLEVIEYVKNEDISVIGLYTRRRNLLGRIFAPSISRKLLSLSDKALFVLRG